MIICWECGKQLFVTLSSAEAELVAVIAGIVASESVGGVIEEIIGDDVIISALCDNQASVRAFANGNLGWRNRHLRMRAAAGRERIQAGSLVVTYVPGSIQLADLATKALARPRILELLDLLHIRSVPDGETKGEGGRILSRLVFEGFNRPLVTPQALAGLALIAAIPRVRGQPNNDRHEVAIQWFGVVSGLVVLLVLWLWVWYLLGRFERGLDSECLSGLGDLDDWHEEFRVAKVVESHISPGLSGQGDAVPGSNSDDEFTEEEWSEVQRKLREIELRTGLTFVQRAKLRRQLHAGGVIEPPNFLQRYGPAPSWYTGALGDEEGDGVVSASAEGSSAATSARQINSAIPPLRGENDWSAIQVQVAKGSGGHLFVHPTAIEEMSDEGEDFEEIGDAGPIDQGEQHISGGFYLSEFFTTAMSHIVCGIFSCVGLRGINWGLLRAVSVGFWNNPVLAVLGQFADTGRFQAVLNGLSYVVVLRFVRSREEGVWLPVSVQAEEVDWISSNPDPQNRGSSGRVSNPDSQNRGSSVGVSNPDPRNRGSSDLDSNLDSQARLSSGGPRNFDRQGWGSSSSGSRVCVPTLVSGPSSRGHVTGLPAPFERTANVQVGGSSSSTDVHVTSNVQVAGSGSHGFNASHWEETYEDYFSEGDSLEDFPLVGTWLKVHFVAQVFSIQGSRVLGYLGHRVSEWAVVRCASIAFRYALIGAVADMLREGPLAVWFQGPQWHQAVEEYICSGEVPGYVGVVNGLVCPDAAQAYVQAESESSEDRQDDPILDELPYVARDPPYRIGRLVLEEENLSGESSDSSTVEPSDATEDAGSGDPAVRGFVGDRDIDHGTPGGLEYQAGEEVLLVNYGDDQGEVSLPDWTGEGIQGVADSLNSGNWSTFDGIVAQVPVEDRDGQLREGVTRRGRIRSWCRPVCFGVFIGFVCWFLRWGFPQAHALPHETCVSPIGPSQGIQLYRTVPETEEEAVSTEVLSCDCEGFTLWLLGWSVALLGVWEFLRLVASKALKIRNRPCDEATQTLGQYVQSPLSEAVPRRANILYCLWRGGHKIDIELYPERIRTEFEGYVGAWLVSQEEGFVSSASSSD